MQVWQSSEDALLQMVVVVLVRLAAENNMLPGWDDLGTGGQLLLVRSTFIFHVFPAHIRVLYIVFNAIQNIMFSCLDPLKRGVSSKICLLLIVLFLIALYERCVSCVFFLLSTIQNHCKLQNF